MTSVRQAGPRETTGRPMGPGGRPGAGQPTAKAEDFWPTARRLIAELAPDRTGVLIVIALGVISVALTVLGPRLLGEATNLIVDGIASPDGIDFPTLRSLLGMVLLLYIAASVFSYLQVFILNGVVQRIVLRFRKNIEQKINRLPLRYFDTTSRGDLLSRVTNDVDNVSQTLQQTLSQIVISVLTVIGVLGMMLALSPVLALVAVVAIPLTLLVTTLVAKRSQPLFAAQWKDTGLLNSQIEEAFTAHSLIKVFNREKDTETRFDTKNQELYKVSFGAQFVSGIIQPASMFIGNLIYVAIAVVGAFQVTAGTLRIGDIQAFIQYARQLTQPLSQLAAMANLLQSGVASAERVFQVLDADDETADPDAAQSPVNGRGELEFQDVSFRYTADVPLISKLSFTAQPGRTVAIVGTTGAGKTTLVNLAMRFYEIDSGRILLDGTDTRSMTRADLRSRFGMVLQDSFIFGGTIRENIAFGQLSATEEEIEEAASATYVDAFVRSLPDGYDTILDQDASNISTGQKQLITIARAYLAQPEILILDEATSSVDTRTEQQLQKAMGLLRANRTSLVIAHRLSTIRDADVILVMDAGAIVEQGTHADLLARDGAYAKLYQAQFAGEPS